MECSFSSSVAAFQIQFNLRTSATGVRTSTAGSGPSVIWISLPVIKHRSHRRLRASSSATRRRSSATPCWWWWGCSWSQSETGWWGHWTLRAWRAWLSGREERRGLKLTFTNGWNVFSVLIYRFWSFINIVSWFSCDWLTVAASSSSTSLLPLAVQLVGVLVHSWSSSFMMSSDRLWLDFLQNHETPAELVSASSSHVCWLFSPDSINK